MRAWDKSRHEAMRKFEWAVYKTGADNVDMPFKIVLPHINI